MTYNNNENKHSKKKQHKDCSRTCLISSDQPGTVLFLDTI